MAELDKLIIRIEADTKALQQGLALATQATRQAGQQMAFAFSDLTSQIDRATQAALTAQRSFMNMASSVQAPLANMTGSVRSAFTGLFGDIETIGRSATGGSGITGLLGKIFGGGSQGTLSRAVGSSAGGLLGAALAPALGPAAPIAGRVLGSLAGGFLGGSKAPSNESAGGFIDPTTGEVFGVQTPKGDGNLSRFNEISETISDALKEIQAITGGVFNSGAFNVAVGSRDAGFTVVNGQKQTFANDEDLVFGAIKAAAQTLTGVNDEFASIVSNASSGQKLVEDIVKISERNDFLQNVKDQFLQLTDPVQAVLEEEKRAAEERLKIAQELGADLTQVEELNAVKLTQTREKALGSDRTTGRLSDALSRLLTGGNSALSAEQQLSFSRSQFNATLAAAQLGDTNALSDIGSVGESFLSQSRNFNASGAAFKSDFNTVTGALQSLLSAQGGETLRNQTFQIVSSIDRQTAKADTNANLISSAIEGLQQQIISLQTALGRSSTAAGARV